LNNYQLNSNKVMGVCHNRKIPITFSRVSLSVNLKSRTEIWSKN